MGKIFAAATINNVWFWVFGVTSILLIILSLFMPPLGEIHPSVVQAVGELFGFATLGTIIYAVDRGIDAKIKHKDTEISIINDENKPNVK